MSKINQRQAQDKIENLESFEGSNFRAEWTSDPFPMQGVLPDDEYAQLCEFVRVHGRAYIVFSYDTPIGWASDHIVKHVPPLRYSITTSKHQGRLRSAWNYYTDYSAIRRAVPANGRTPFTARMGW